MSYTIYRVTNATDRYVGYHPVRRSGKPVTFKTKAQGKVWLKENPPKTVAIDTRFEVRRTIKYPKGLYG